MCWAAGQGSGRAQLWAVPGSSLSPVPFQCPQNVPSAQLPNPVQAQGQGIGAAGQGGDSPGPGAPLALWRSRKRSRRRSRSVPGQRELSGTTGAAQESRNARVQAGGMGTEVAEAVLAPGRYPGHLSQVEMVPATQCQAEPSARDTLRVPSTDLLPLEALEPLSHSTSGISSSGNPRELPGLGSQLRPCPGTAWGCAFRQEFCFSGPRAWNGLSPWGPGGTGPLCHPSGPAGAAPAPGMASAGSSSSLQGISHLWQKSQSRGGRGTGSGPTGSSGSSGNTGNTGNTSNEWSRAEPGSDTAAVTA